MSKIQKIDENRWRYLILKENCSYLLNDLRKFNEIQEFTLWKWGKKKANLAVWTAGMENWQENGWVRDGRSTDVFCDWKGVGPESRYLDVLGHSFWSLVESCSLAGSIGSSLVSSISFHPTGGHHGSSLLRISWTSTYRRLDGRGPLETVADVGDESTHLGPYHAIYYIIICGWDYAGDILSPESQIL